jgi:hypothetical protein
MTWIVQENEYAEETDARGWPIVRQLPSEHNFHDIAIVNAYLWLTQASRGEVPSGGINA